MNVNNPPKLYGILLTILGLFVLVGIGRVGFSEVLPIITLIVGYLVGNGVAAKRGDPVEPVLGMTSNRHPLPPPNQEG